MTPLNRLFSVAPMMAYTDRHFRYLLRLISKKTLLYTEMLTAAAIIHGDQPYLLDFSCEEHPLALQLGGADPKQLASAAKIGEKWGYDEINLNVGCPSDRVQQGCFGAALMKTPQRVAEIFLAMQSAVTIPVTIKTRLGVDEYDSEFFLHDFIGKSAEAGCRVFILHARKAWLKGLSPKENREVPPLMHDRVYQIKKNFPALTIILNGGIQNLDESEMHLKYVDGVMLGRAPCSNPFLLADVDRRFSGDKTFVTRENVLSQYLDYMSAQVSTGVPIRHMTRHLIGLFQGLPGARKWRQWLSNTPAAVLTMCEARN